MAGQIKEHSDFPCYYDPNTYSYDDFTIYKGSVSKDNLVSRETIYASGIRQHAIPVDYAMAYTYDLKEINIVNKKSPNKLRALIIKDSYVNPMIFQYAHHFETTTYYDIRHNRDRSVFDFVNQNKFDLVILLYNDEVYVDPMYIFDRVPPK
ncbi:hypothetical protein [Brevibacillus daliensis]|uniref:hypothetical protein n=1 Tax=Brevibacillus daliensis TaxID=2892995 RepID=UPI001E31B87E|nr:hypothetical protein [Brevibacillus daliensis]